MNRELGYRIKEKIKCNMIRINQNRPCGRLGSHHNVKLPLGTYYVYGSHNGKLIKLRKICNSKNKKD